MSRRTEIQVGAAVLVALVVLLVGVTWLKQISLAGKMTVWHVRFEEAGGVGVGVPVQVNGIKKGTVKSVSLVGDHVNVDLSVESDVHLTDRSRIGIRDLGVMGDKIIVIDLDIQGHPVAKADTILGEYQKGLPEMLAELGRVVSSVAEITDNLRETTSGPKGGELAATVRNFRATSEELRRTVAENRATLKATLENFQAASRTARGLTTDREAELKKSLDDFSHAAENMNRLSMRLDSLRATLQTVSGRVERGEGSLGKLVNDEQLYTNLSSSLKSLNELIADIKAHPKKYFKVSVF